MSNKLQSIISGIGSFVNNVTLPFRGDGTSKLGDDAVAKSEQDMGNTVHCGKGEKGDRGDDPYARCTQAHGNVPSAQCTQAPVQQPGIHRTTSPRPGMAGVNSMPGHDQNTPPIVNPGRAWQPRGCSADQPDDAVTGQCEAATPGPGGRHLSPNPPREPLTRHSSGGGGDADGRIQRNAAVPTTTIVKRQIDHCVRDMLGVIRRLVESNAEPPLAMVRLNKMADKVENGWVRVMESLITEVPLEDALGPAVINLLVDECPLPTRQALQMLCSQYSVNKSGAQRNKGTDTRKYRNICVILGCLAEKMAGPGSVQLLTDDVFGFLSACMDYDRCDPCVILHALIALEKFAQTNENKLTIIQKFGKKKDTNALVKLEQKLPKKGKLGQKPADYPYLELNFCVQWSLTHLFIVEGHPVNQPPLKNINVMLNCQDVSEYLKLAPNGLQARCDASSFESVRCTYQVEKGVWYYEVEIITPGVMQIGWATKDSKFLNHEGYGIGDDEHSLAYDGCRQLIWHNAQSERHDHRPWEPGDILGCLLNIEDQYVRFFLNGEPCRQTCDHLFRSHSRGAGFFAAASFMSFQQCKFNFGAEKFMCKPRGGARCFNDSAELTTEQRQNISKPRAGKVAQDLQVAEDACIVCCDNTADTTLKPCNHQGLCWSCAQQLDQCPHCRVPITIRTAPNHKDTSIPRQSSPSQEQQAIQQAVAASLADQQRSPLPHSEDNHPPQPQAHNMSHGAQPISEDPGKLARCDDRDQRRNESARRRRRQGDGIQHKAVRLEKGQNAQYGQTSGGQARNQQQGRQKTRVEHIQITNRAQQRAGVLQRTNQRGPPGGKNRNQNVSVDSDSLGLTVTGIQPQQRGTPGGQQSRLSGRGKKASQGSSGDQGFQHSESINQNLGTVGRSPGEQHDKRTTGRASKSRGKQTRNRFAQPTEEDLKAKHPFSSLNENFR